MHINLFYRLHYNYVKQYERLVVFMYGNNNNKKKNVLFFTLQYYFNNTMLFVGKQKIKNLFTIIIHVRSYFKLAIDPKTRVVHHGYRNITRTVVFFFFVIRNRNTRPSDLPGLGVPVSS